jgi:hypothetical protein
MAGECLWLDVRLKWLTTSTEAAVVSHSEVVMVMVVTPRNG